MIFCLTGWCDEAKHLIIDLSVYFHTCVIILVKREPSAYIYIYIKFVKFSHRNDYVPDIFIIIIFLVYFVSETTNFSFHRILFYFSRFNSLTTFAMEQQLRSFFFSFFFFLCARFALTILLLIYSRYNVVLLFFSHEQDRHKFVGETLWKIRLIEPSVRKVQTEREREREIWADGTIKKIRRKGVRN